MEWAELFPFITLYVPTTTMQTHSCYLCLSLTETGKWTLPLGPEDFKSQFQGTEWEVVVRGIRESCLWCYLISPARERASRRNPWCTLSASDDQWGGIGRLRRLIAANTAAAEHFTSSSRLALTSQRLNLGDGKRVQSGEKSVPDDFLLLCSFSSGVTPLPTSATAPKCASVLPVPPPHKPPSHPSAR